MTVEIRQQEFRLSQLLIQTNPQFQFRWTSPIGVNEDLDTGSATGSDECDQDVTVTSSSSDFIGTSYCDGKVKTITWTATDVCGLSASDTQQITVKDTTKPTVSAPNDFILECGISSQNADTGTATGLDACDSSVVISSSSIGLQGTSFCESAGGMRNAITWTATDDCGFTDSAVQTITVYDKTAPTVLVPQDYTLECNVNQDMDTGSATGLHHRLQACKVILIVVLERLMKSRGPPLTTVDSRIRTAKPLQSGIPLLLYCPTFP